MKSEILKEITPLTANDCFTIFYRIKDAFDFPLHHHDEYELNFIENGTGSKRMVGDHMAEIGDTELVLVGPNLVHGWFTHNCTTGNITEITIQFHRELFDESFLHRTQMRFLRQMLRQSLRGISFSHDISSTIKPRLLGITEKQGFASVLELMNILHELSMSKNNSILSDSSFDEKESLSFNSRRVEAVMHLLNRNYSREITLGQAAKMAAMSDVAFSRFFKMRTGKTFVDTLNEIRLGHASRMLIQTTHTVNEIAYKCGFNNMSNFNRIFKKKKGCTPKEFREEYNTSGLRAFV